jgi:hypothetical protein
MHHPRGVWKLLSRFFLALVMAIATGHAIAGAGLSPGSWTSIGPDNAPGRVTSIAIHPTQHNRMWIGTGSGGIWYSANAGASWAPVNDFLPSLVITSIVISPANPNVMYATTGELFPNPYPHADAREPRLGAGILRSTDGGSTWQVLPATTNSDFRYTHAVAVHPGDPSILLAATSLRLFRSTDGGGVWQSINNVDAPLRSVQFDPTNADRVIATSGERPYLSTDAGVSWNYSWTTSPKSAGGPVIGYSRQPGVVYAAGEWTSACCILGGRVFRSTNAGSSWPLRSEPNHLGTRLPPSQAIWVDPTNSNHVIVGGEHLYRSTDGALTWTQISSGGQAGSVPSGIQTIVASPGYNGTSNRTVYVGTSAGLFRAADIQAVTATNVGWTSLNNGLATTEFFGGAGHAGTNGRILGGTTSGTLVYPGAGTSWTPLLAGEGGRVAIDPLDGNVVYGTIPKLRVHRSDTGGPPASDISAGIGTLSLPERAAVPPPIALDPANRDVMLAGGLNLWRSNNVRAPGPTWTNVRPRSVTEDVAFRELISAIAFTPGNPDSIWLGTNDAGLYKTSNGTAATPTWTRIGLGVLPVASYKSILVDPIDPNLVYVALAPIAMNPYASLQHPVWRSTNGGATWAGFGPGPTSVARTIVRHPTIPGYLYAGTDNGIYTKEGAGAWSAANLGPANVRVDELFWIGNTLYAATHGRGMFRAMPNANTGTFTLTVGKDGDGTGPVTSSPAGISCGSDCDAQFAPGTSVTLTATPNAGSYFIGWSGCSSQTTSCVVTMGAESRSVRARFSTSPASAWFVQLYKLGGGSGSVISSPAGMSCGSVCRASFTSETATFYATANAGSVFAGWSHAQCTGQSPCVLSRNSSQFLYATFEKAGFPLTVTKTGAGSGPVTSSPAGITCGLTCDAHFAANTTVTLTATPNPGSLFGGWSGACTGSSSVCVVSMTAAKSVSARFDLPGQHLSILKGGDGSGSVTSSPAGISCGSTCSFQFQNESTVTLTPTAHAGSVFDHWSGDCIGNGACTLTMTGGKQVFAYFSKGGQPLVVAKAGSGSGAVSSVPAGIACGVTCQASFATGSTVTLTVSANTGSTFAGWSGACTGTGPCVVTMSGYQYVTATFNRAGHPLTVSKSGTGSGPVTSSPAGIECGSACTNYFAAGSTVTLTVTPNAGSAFAGWSGACSGTGSCVVTMDAAKNVTATINRADPLLTVTKAGTGSGPVTSNPAGISCGTTCAARFPPGSAVTLTATPNPGSSFAGWSGACTGTSSCVVTLDADTGVQATFNDLPGSTTPKRSTTAR